MQRASYRYGIGWIAENDESGSSDRLNVDVVRGYVSSILLADLFDVTTEKVAADVVAYRKQQPHLK